VFGLAWSGAARELVAALVGDVPEGETEAAVGEGLMVVCGIEVGTASAVVWSAVGDGLPVAPCGDLVSVGLTCPCGVA